MTNASLEGEGVRRGLAWGMARVTAEPQVKHPCAQQPAVARPWGQEGSLRDSRFSLMPMLTGYTIYYELSTRGDGMLCLSLAVSSL